MKKIVTSIMLMMCMGVSGAVFAMQPDQQTTAPAACDAQEYAVPTSRQEFQERLRAVSATIGKLTEQDSTQEVTVEGLSALLGRCRVTEEAPQSALAAPQDAVTKEHDASEKAVSNDVKAEAKDQDVILSKEQAHILAGCTAELAALKQYSDANPEVVTPQQKRTLAATGKALCSWVRGHCPNPMNPKNALIVGLAAYIAYLEQCWGHCPR